MIGDGRSLSAPMSFVFKSGYVDRTAAIKILVMRKHARSARAREKLGRELTADSVFSRRDTACRVNSRLSASTRVVIPRAPLSSLCDRLIRCGAGTLVSHLIRGDRCERRVLADHLHGNASHPPRKPATWFRPRDGYRTRSRLVCAPSSASGS